MKEPEYDLPGTKRWLMKLKESGFTFPNTYMVFDMETTGVDWEEDFILELGFMIVVDGKIHEHPQAIRLNWYLHPEVDPRYLEQRMRETEARMLTKKKSFTFSPEKIRTGLDPVPILRAFHGAVFDWSKRRGDTHFLVHNGFKFDSRIVESHFHRYLSDDDGTFRFDSNRIIDTGLFERGAQLDKEYLPVNGDMTTFYNRVILPHSFKKWSLEPHCATKYKLFEKPGLGTGKSHTADFDCLATHHLYQTYREMVEVV
jgi:DNA polymerase III epsilon subunit-like protein